MKLLWTESPNVIDKIIKLMTAEDCGHFAILFESVHGTGVVFESNLLGTHPAFYSTWLKGRTIVHELDFNLSPAQEDAIWDAWVTNFDGRGYDFLGCIYVGLMKLRHRLFGTPMPNVNKWSTKNTFYCDVIYQILSGIEGFPKMDASLNQMSSPHDVFVYLSNNLEKLDNGHLFLR